MQSPSSKTGLQSVQKFDKIELVKGYVVALIRSNNSYKYIFWSIDLSKRGDFAGIDFFGIFSCQALFQHTDPLHNGNISVIQWSLETEGVSLSDQASSPVRPSTTFNFYKNVLDIVKTQIGSGGLHDVVTHYPDREHPGCVTYTIYLH